MSDEFDSGFDDLEFDAFDSGARKPAETFRSNAAEVLKGAGKGMAKAAIEGASSTVPGGSAFYREMASTARELDDPVRQLKSELGKAGTELKRLGRATLPGMQKYLPPRLYQRLTNLTQDKNKLRSRNEAEAKEAELQSSLDDTLSMNKAILDSGIAAQFAQNKMATTQIGVLSEIQKQHIFANKYRVGVQRSYMRKNLELQYRHLAVMAETRDIAKASLRVSETAFERMIHNLSLPDSVKARTLDSLKGKARGILVSKGMSGLSNVLSSMLKTNLGSLTQGVGSLSEMAGMMADGTEMANEMGVSLFDPRSAVGGVVGQALVRKLFSKMPSGMRRHASGISDQLYDVLQSSTKGGVGAKQWLNKRGGKLGMFGKLLGDAFDGPTEVKFQNKFLTDPDGPGQITNRFIHTITDVLPAYQAEIERHLHNMSTGQANEKKIYDVVNGKLANRAAAKRAMDVHLFGTNDDRAKSLGTAVGASMAALRKKSPLLQGKDIEKIITRIISNAMAFNIPLHSYILEDVLNVRSDDELKDPTLVKLTAGVTDKVKALRMVYSAITDSSGRERMNVTRRINRGIYDGMLGPDKLKSLGLIGSGQYRQMYGNARDGDGNFKRAYFGSILNETTGLPYAQQFTSGYNSVLDDGYEQSYRLDEELGLARKKLSHAKDITRNKALKMPVIGKVIKFVDENSPRFNKKIQQQHRKLGLRLPAWLRNKNGETKKSEVSRLQDHLIKMGQNSTYDEVTNLINATRAVELEKQLSIQKLDTVSTQEQIEIQRESNFSLRDIKEFMKVQVFNTKSWRSTFLKLEAAIFDMPFKLASGFTSMAMSGLGLFFKPITQFFSKDRRKEELEDKEKATLHYTRVENLLTAIALSSGKTAENTDEEETRAGSWMSRRKKLLGEDEDVEVNSDYQESKGSKFANLLKNGLKLLAATLLVGTVGKVALPLLKKLPSGSQIASFFTGLPIFDKEQKNFKKDDKDISEMADLFEFKDQKKKAMYIKLMEAGKLEAARAVLKEDQDSQTGRKAELRKQRHASQVLESKKLFKDALGKYNLSESDREKLHQHALVGNTEYMKQAIDLVVKQAYREKGMTNQPKDRLSEAGRRRQLVDRADKLRRVKFEYDDGTVRKLNEADIKHYIQLCTTNPSSAAVFLGDMLWDEKLQSRALDSNGFLGMVKAPFADYLKNFDKFGVTKDQKKLIIDKLLAGNRHLELQWYLDDVIFLRHQQLNVEKQRKGIYVDTKQLQRMGLSTGAAGAYAVRGAIPKVARALSTGVSKFMAWRKAAKLRKIERLKDSIRPDKFVRGKLAEFGLKVREGAASKFAKWGTFLKNNKFVQAVGSGLKKTGEWVAKAFKDSAKGVAKWAISKLPAPAQKVVNEILEKVLALFVKRGFRFLGGLMKALGSATFYLIIFVIGIIMGMFEKNIYYFATDNLSGGTLSDVLAYLAVVLDPFEAGKLVTCAIRAVPDLIRVHRSAKQSSSKILEVQERLRREGIIRLKEIAKKKGHPELAEMEDFDALATELQRITEEEAARSLKEKAKDFANEQIQVAKDTFKTVGEKVSATTTDLGNKLTAANANLKERAGATADAVSAKAGAGAAAVGAKVTAVNTNLASAKQKAKEKLTSVKDDIQALQMPMIPNVNGPMGDMAAGLGASQYLDKLLEANAQYMETMNNNVANMAQVMGTALTTAASQNGELVNAVRESIPRRTPQSILNRSQKQ